MPEICKTRKHPSKEHSTFKPRINSNLTKETGWFTNNRSDKTENVKCIILTDRDFAFSIGVKKGHVHSNHREKVPKSFCATITPFSKCTPSTPVQCVHHFCSLRTSSVLAGLTSIFCFVFDTTNKWAGHFERSDFFWSSLPGMNHLNWVVIARIFIYIILIGCTVYYIHLFTSIFTLL